MSDNEEEGKKKAPPKPPNWQTTQARKIVMMDLHDGSLPIDEKLLPADMAWEIYRYQPEFVKEHITEEQFKRNLASNREQMAKKHEESDRQMAAYIHDLALYPVKEHKPDGKPVFLHHPAHEKLHEDVEEEIHKQMDPVSFKKSRDEYKPWGKNTFETASIKPCVPKSSTGTSSMKQKRTARNAKQATRDVKCF